MFLSRRGNPPKGFRASEVIYGKKASWLMQYTAAINQITLNVPPQRRYPDRPPLMVKDVLCWYVVLCDGRKKNMIVQFICWTAKVLMIKTTSLSIRNNKNRTLKYKIKARFLLLFSD